MKKMTCSFLIFITLSSFILASCRNENSTFTDGTQSDTYNAVSEDKSVETDVSPLPDNTFDGRSFTIFQCTHLVTEHYAPEANGDVLNDAIYERNITIADKYGIDLQFTDTDYNKFPDYVRNAVLANDAAYDMLSGHAVFTSRLISENVFMDFKTVPYIRDGLEYDWWNRNVVKDLSLKNKVFLIAGDIGYFNIGHVEGILFNKKLFDDANFPYPYEMVIDHSWTYDNYANIIKDANKDLDGDGKMTGGADLFGFSSMQLFADVMFFFNFGGSSITKDENDIPTLNFNNEANVKRIETGYKWLIENTTYQPPYPGQNDYTLEASHIAFKNNLAYTFCTMLKNLSVFRDMNTDYGVVPFPLLDENQENYISQIDGGTSMVALPITCDSEFSGLVIEALARGSTNTVVPAFYESTLLGKYSRDEMSVEMFKILRETTHYDLGYICNLGTGFIATDIIHKDGNVASYYAKNESTLTKALETFVEKLND